MSDVTSENNSTSSDFIRTIIRQDLSSGKNGNKVHTRFPPEPNGYLHIGHAKSICLNFGIAKEFNGLCNLRFDDTNPAKEEQEYVDSIQEDVSWLGFSWDERKYFASDYFEQLYDFAVHLIKAGKAYVCHLSPDEVRQYRGTLTEPGKDSPYRNRSVEENLDLFQQMRDGKIAEGACTLRAKIDMSSGNINLRDPAIYRVKFAHHHRTGDAWCIYPMYDYTHCISDALEGITHSICTLEFEDHRPLYDWCLDQLPVPCHPQQIEFARLNLTFTVLSKRKLLQLVTEKHVSGWDDPLMPTISGFRRRGYTPKAIRDFCQAIGVAKADSTVDIAMLEFFLRDDLNTNALRRMAVINPLKVVITNYPEGQVEQLSASNHPNRPELGQRQLPFSREIYIERDDFEEVAPKKFFRLTPGQEVRLMHAYYITCTDVVKNAAGEITEVHCTYDPATKGGDSPDGRKVKGTIHWVCAKQGIDLEARLFEHLFIKEFPEDTAEGENFLTNINPNARSVITAKGEPALATAEIGQSFQFMRQGYFCPDLRDHKAGAAVFNRTVSLKDSWSKVAQGK